MVIYLMGNIFIIIGVLLAIIGILFKYGLLGWFGNLPLDFRYQSEDGKFGFYAPMGSMIVVSVMLSILIKIFGKFGN